MSKTMSRKHHIPMNLQLFAGEPNPVVDPVVDPVAFDPKNLSPEMATFLDQERTRASKTAADNARKKLMQDESFRTEIRTELEKSQEMTIEEKMAQKEAALLAQEATLALRENTLVTTKSLLEHGIDGENADALASILTTADKEVSVSNVDTFAKLFDAALTASTEKATQALLQNGNPITTNGTDGAPSYQQQYQSAVTSKNFSEQVRIKTEAASKGVMLT